MTEQLRPGSRVRIVIEDTIESNSGSDITTTGRITLEGLTAQNATVTVLEPGWQVGDLVNDGYSDLLRIARDGVELWQRPDGRVVWDDETSLKHLTVVRRASEERRP